MVLLMAARPNREPINKYTPLLIDVKKAHLNGKVLEDEWAYVALPAEAGGGAARCTACGWRPGPGKKIMPPSS